MVLNRLNKNGDASRFIDHVFRAFDEDNNGYIDVIEYIIGNYLSSNISTLDEKLSFAFKLYDIGIILRYIYLKKKQYRLKFLFKDRDGRIELDEIVKLIESLYDLRGVRKDSLPIDRQPENVAREIMRRFDQNGDFFITENEFIQGCKDNANIGRIILSTFN